MPFVPPTQTIQSVLTDQARDLFARAVLGDLSFQLSGFKVGRGGYDDALPVHTIPVIASSTALIDPVFPLGGGVQPFAAFESPYPNVTAVVCRLGRLDALFGLGEIGVFARVTRTGTFATFQHVVGVTNGLEFIAKTAGPTGNFDTIRLANNGINQVLSVSTSGSDVVVNLATDGLGIVTSTLAHVANAVRTDPSANLILAAASFGVSSTICTILPVTFLAGGTSPASPYTVGSDYLFALAHTPLISKTNLTVLVARVILSLGYLISTFGLFGRLC